MTVQARLFALAIGVIATASVLAQGYVFIDIVARRGGGILHVIWTMLGFLTILTNLLIALVCFALYRRRWPGWWPDQAATLGCLTVNILMVGAIYHIALSSLWDPQGLHWLSDQGLHSVVPALFFAFWLGFAPKQGLRASHALWWLLYPAGYFVYALYRGGLDGWYPYPFIDVTQLGIGRVLVNAGVIGAVTAFTGLALIMVTQASARKP